MCGHQRKEKKEKEKEKRRNILMMIEPYQQKRAKKIILDEDEYIQKLESIIERDYFPDTAEYRLLQNDHLVNRIVKRKVDDENNNNGDDNNENDNETSMKEGIDESTLSVNNFFEIYNSEDNESFEKLQEKQLAEKRRKFHWLYETPGGKNAGMLMWYHQGGQILTVEEREKMDKLLECPTTVGDDRPNGTDTWRFRVRNQLMFPPELEASKDTCLLPSSDPSALARISYSSEFQNDPNIQQTNDGAELSLTLISSEIPNSKRICPQQRTLNLPNVEITPIKSNREVNEKKLMPPPSIIPQNTRLKDKVTPFTTLGSSYSPLEAPHTPSSIGSIDGDNHSHSYHSVCMTPSPLPGNKSSSSSQFNSPLITWGEICGTPNVLTASSSSSLLEENPFVISELSEREKSVRLLDQQLNQKKRKSFKGQKEKGNERGDEEEDVDEKKRKNTSLNKTKNISRLLGTPLTPAGRALATKLSSNIISEWGGSLERQTTKLKKTQRGAAAAAAGETRGAERAGTSSVEIMKSSKLIKTDNLLHL